MHLTGPWIAACLFIVVGGAAFFGWLGADDFGPKDFLSHIGSAMSGLLLATRIGRGDS